MNYQGPIVLAIMDGVGLRKEATGNAVNLSHTEFLNYAMSHYPTMALLAHGEAVGILPDDMGNSEVGHNALGSGQIIKQGIAQIEDQFATGQIWQSAAWRGAIDNVKQHHSTLHFAGIFSDGNVHSSIRHLEHMIEQAHAEGVEHIRIHLVLDGRDVPPQSEPKYIQRLEQFIAHFSDHPDYQIASGGGRMVFVADRYENDWGIVERGWNAICHGQADHQFRTATEAINFFRTADPTVQDQYLPAFVIVKDDQPIGPVKDGDSFIYYDFRADRAIEIAQAFTYEDFNKFDRGYGDANQRPAVYFAGMTEYNSDTHVPEHQLVSPIQIKDPLNQILGQHGISQLAISETVKFGHITYYFNGNSYEKAAGEEHIEIPSDTQPFDTRPWMKSAETTDVLLDRLADFKFARINFAGGDMVGHFGELEPTITAMEAIDIQLQRIAKKVDELGGVLIITADHGNAEELIDPATGKPKTSHTTNLVPCIFYDNTDHRISYTLNPLDDAGLSNIAPTIALFCGLSPTDLPTSWRQPLVKLTA